MKRSKTCPLLVGFLDEHHWNAVECPSQPSQTQWWNHSPIEVEGVAFKLGARAWSVVLRSRAPCILPWQFSKVVLCCRQSFTTLYNEKSVPFISSYTLPRILRRSEYPTSMNLIGSVPPCSCWFFGSTSSGAWQVEASAATAFLGDSSNRPSPKGLKGRNGQEDGHWTHWTFWNGWCWVGDGDVVICWYDVWNPII